ncbi:MULTISPECIES: LysR family transcriptional regulator [unclassified Rhizobium]|uniref:LysR family transcriptional regulator n=1 Tax=unclassified Rhizobium TaxID=2613769 RepID=UPI001ADB7AE8|nr:MULTISPECIES: LysR family transcriptional regulator [unclassified Rhizobium]MBO9101210.1 LysR family transcriptional regulator [Rhizobium sp. L58/93]MBO9170864.1 LysR family transcriptional regulator [Rhizobium sp. L245/93]MBO9186776.1 LysR family transcriptional regulator [Rhizobium sp. E27B/91]QXZ86327.1 LysR family transcriptional regulator [Rhizobium sp. K1/93]QXZ92218.1 LysR family transcriptional regulator [Rhizobium sp. K15/93]
MADWENLRHFLAVAHSGTLSGAARALKVDHATVSRRLAALEAELDVVLVNRLPRSCRLTAIGQQVLDQAVTMESAANGIARIARAAHTPLIGKVTLSAPPVLAAHLLAQHLARFRSLYPDIRLSLAAQAQQVSLSRREADVALRLVRPEETGSFALKLGVMPFGLYARRDYPHPDEPDRWQFIAYDESFADMPQQKWLLGVAGARSVACELNDISGHLIAARAGAGVAGLPCFLGDAGRDLVRIGEDAPSFSREIWVVVHRDLRKTPSVRAVMDFVIALITQHGGFSA